MQSSIALHVMHRLSQCIDRLICTLQDRLLGVFDRPAMMRKKSSLQNILIHIANPTAALAQQSNQRVLQIASQHIP